MMNQITIYADGACKKTKIGGWGCHLTFNGVTKELYGGKRDTTNNQMELQAPIEAMKALKTPCKGVLYTDSNYVVQGIMSWIHNWIPNGRLKPEGDLKNKELWLELYDLTYKRGHEIRFAWVKGHNGDPGNERADELANLGWASVCKG